MEPKIAPPTQELAAPSLSEPVESSISFNFKLLSINWVLITQENLFAPQKRQHPHTNVQPYFYWLLFVDTH